MKARRYHITLNHHEENLSYVRFHDIVELHTHVPPMKPTVANARETIASLFPAFEISEKWDSLKEQIDCLDYFSIDVLPKDRPLAEFESYSVGFMEV